MKNFKSQLVFLFSLFIVVISECPAQSDPNTDNQVVFGDLNEDGCINISDIVINISNIYENTFNMLGDFNQDGVINVLDILQELGDILDGLNQCEYPINEENTDINVWLQNDNLYYESNVDIFGFQFEYNDQQFDCSQIETYLPDYQFQITCSEQIIIGFSIEGTPFPASSIGIIPSLYDLPDQFIFVDENGNPISYSLTSPNEIFGCTDSMAINYDPIANSDDGTCTFSVYGCTDVTASNYNADANTNDDSCVSWEDLAVDLLDQLENIIPEDGITQDDLEVAFYAGVASIDVQAAFDAGVASVEICEFEDITTQNIPLDLPQGWSMFGYTCINPIDLAEAFFVINDKIALVKDELGTAYLPEWSFNAIGDLTFSEGYQIKMLEEITDFQFCSTIIIPSNSNIVLGCTDLNAFNYNDEADEDDGSCQYYSEGTTPIFYSTSQGIGGFQIGFNTLSDYEYATSSFINENMTVVNSPNMLLCYSLSAITIPPGEGFLLSISSDSNLEIQDIIFSTPNGEEIPMNIEINSNGIFITEVQ